MMRVLIGDDNRECANLLAAHVTACGAEVAGVVTSGGLAVIQKNRALRPDVVLVDLTMKQYNGLTVCRTILSRYPEQKVVLVSNSTDAHSLIMDCGAYAVLPKPWASKRLKKLLETLAAECQPAPVAVAA